jgi:hypothetical protein
MGAPRFGGSTGLPSMAGLAFAGAGVSAGAVFSAGFVAFAASSTDVSPPK